MLKFSITSTNHRVLLKNSVKFIEAQNIEYSTNDYIYVVKGIRNSYKLIFSNNITCY